MCNFEAFLKEGVSGLVDFIMDIITKDDERNYTCTDSARNKFHRLLESRDWKEDNGAIFLNKILDELKESVKTYNSRLTNMLRTSDREIQEDGDAKLTRTRPLYNAILYSDSKERETIFNKVRSKVRKLATI